MSSIPDPIVTNWVPLGGDSRERAAYWGSYESSRIYNDGDCAIGADGILYLCTKNGTNTAPVAWPKSAGLRGVPGPQGPQGIGMPAPVVEGQWLKGVGGAAVWAPLLASDVPNIKRATTYGTLLPDPPVDGQEHILVDSVSAPTWSWRCRYNAQTSSGYKWEVLGGTSLNGNYSVQQTIPTGVWTSLAAPISLPKEGTYMFSGSCRTMNTTAAGQNYLAFYANTGPNYFGPIPVQNTSASWWGSLMISQFTYSFVIGTLIGLTAYANVATGYFDMVIWSIMPLRIKA